MRRTILLVVGVLLAFNSGTQATVIMDWVTVGNPGNADDTNGRGGGVSDVYQIGTYEVTTGQYTEFLNTVAATDSHGLYNSEMWSSDEGCKIQQSGSSGSYTYSVAADWANRPVNYVEWYDTLRFANWLHNGQGTGDTEDGAYDMSLGSSVVRKDGATVFLPTEDEWYKAAYHKNDGVTDNYFNYPTSSNTMPGRDMTEATNAGNNANYKDFYSDDYLIGSPYYRTEVGEFELSDSPYGTFDMAGNVWEWNETAIKEGSIYVIQSGSYSNYAFGLGNYGAESDYESGIKGFRVASVPEPATVLLLAMGSLAIIKRRQ